MRTTDEQRARTRHEVARTMGETTRMWLFGSHVDAQAKGGDIDLHIQPDTSSTDVIDQQMKLYPALQRALGEQRIDLVVHCQGAPLRPIDDEALRTGLPL